LLFSCCVAAGAASSDEKVQFTSFSSTSSSVTLSWEKADGAVGYKVYEFQNDIASTVKKTAGCSMTITGLKPDTEYIFKVRSYTKDKNGNTVNGALSDALTVRTRLEDIQNLRFVSASQTAIKIGWDKVEKAEYYRISVAPFGQSSYKNVGKTTDNSFTVSGLDGKTGYKIRVVAAGNKNTSAYTRISLYTKPAAVRSVKAVSNDYSSITLQWDKTSAATRYYVYASETKDGKYTLKGATDKTTFKASFNSAGKKYYIKVRAAAQNEYQNTLGSFSDIISASTKAYPFSISIKSKSIRQGEYIYLSVPHYKNVEWTSSNTNVISLKGSRAYAASTGTATITAKSGSRKTSVKITVGAPVVSYMSCVYDYTNDKMVFSNKLNSRCYPASITKLITALVALKYMSVNDTITVGSELNLVESNSSRCGIQKGEKFRLGDLLYGLLLPSGGDAAYSIAVNCARKVSKNQNMGYVEAKNYFVSLMNSYMKSIGATGTHCVNPHGYPVNGHYSTVHDLVLVAKQVLKNPTLKTVTATSSKYIKALTGKGRTWNTTNQLLNRSSSYYSPYAHGLKTGTVANNYTGIVSAATKNGRTIITVAVGCESFDARYKATHKLYNAYL
ncbi:MAG: fibronectin type III domain-containing protein, partial [Acutalibacteraceae bacterium]